MLAAVSTLKRRCSNNNIIQLNLWLLEGSRQEVQDLTGMNLNCPWLSFEILCYLSCSTIGFKDNLVWRPKQNSLGKHYNQELSCAFPRHFNETFDYSLEFWGKHYTRVWPNIFWLLKSTCVHSWAPGLSDEYVHPNNGCCGFQQAFLLHAKGENNIICED